MLNPLWPTSDDMWWHRIWTALVQLMPSCLTAPGQSMLNNLVAFTWGQYRGKTRLVWFKNRIAEYNLRNHDVIRIPYSWVDLVVQRLDQISPCPRVHPQHWEGHPEYRCRYFGSRLSPEQLAASGHQRDWCPVVQRKITFWSVYIHPQQHNRERVT